MVGPYDSVTDHLMRLTEDKREGGTEFGGVAGIRQPYPHEPSPSETLHALYATNSTDPDGWVPDTDQAAPPPR